MSTGIFLIDDICFINPHQNSVFFSQTLHNTNTLFQDLSGEPSGSSRFNSTADSSYDYGYGADSGAGNATPGARRKKKCLEPDCPHCLAPKCGACMFCLKPALKSKCVKRKLGNAA
jgi:hypothetical protein